MIAGRPWSQTGSRHRMRMHPAKMRCSGVLIRKARLITAVSRWGRNGSIMGIHMPLNGNKYILSIRPSELSYHRSCRQEGVQGEEGYKGTLTTQHILAIYHLARSKAGRVLAFRPRGIFTIGDPSFAAPSFQPAFSHPHQRELMYSTWLEWLYAHTRAHARTSRRILNVSGEHERCGVPWGRCCRVVSVMRDTFARIPPRELSACVGPLSIHQFHRTFNREGDTTRDVSTELNEKGTAGSKIGTNVHACPFVLVTWRRRELSIFIGSPSAKKSSARETTWD